MRTLTAACSPSVFCRAPITARDCYLHACISAIPDIPCPGSSDACGDICSTPGTPCTRSYGNYARISAIPRNPCMHVLFRRLCSHFREGILAPLETRLAPAGLSSTARHGRALVFTTLAQSSSSCGPAEEAGVRCEDRIISIDSCPVLDVQQAIELLQGEPGTVRRVTIERRDAPRSVSFWQKVM